MKTKTKNRIIILLLGFSFVFNGYLFIENKNKATTIVQLNKNSKIIKITDNEIEFTFNLNNDTEKKRLIVQNENNDIHFKLEDVS